MKYFLDADDADTLAEAAIAVTGDGVTCTTYDDCLDKLESGDDINYDGVSGQIALDDNGDPIEDPDELADAELVKALLAKTASSVSR